jgi:hypothetical protein
MVGWLDNRKLYQLTAAIYLGETKKPLIAFCPDMVDQASAGISGLSRREQIAAVAAELSFSGSFGFWWD